MQCPFHATMDGVPAPHSISLPGLSSRDEEQCSVLRRGRSRIKPARTEAARLNTEAHTAARKPVPSKHRSTCAALVLHAPTRLGAIREEMPWTIWEHARPAALLYAPDR